MYKENIEDNDQLMQVPLIFDGSTELGDRNTFLVVGVRVIVVIQRDVSHRIVLYPFKS